MGWGSVTSLLEETSKHSTSMGKLWFTLVIVLRIVLTVVCCESIYDDEQRNFVCNTQIPGFSNLCYNAFAPLSHIRFWVLQVIAITLPSILYLGYAMNKIARMDDEANSNSEEVDNKEEGQMSVNIELNQEREVSKKQKKKHDGRGSIKRYGLMTGYVIQLLLRAIIETIFLIMQLFLYGFKVAYLYDCKNFLSESKVNCFVSRSTEKSIFLWIMFIVSISFLILTLVEISYLGISGIRDTLCTKKSQM